MEFKYYKIPSSFFGNGKYSKILSHGAKLLYCIMLDRVSLSIKNQWFTANGQPYILFSVENIVEILNCSKGSANSYLAELEKSGLLERRRQGQGKPNFIIVKTDDVCGVSEVQKMDNKKFKNCISCSTKNELSEVQKLDFKNTKNCTSSSTKNRLLEVQKLDCNHTDINQTNITTINPIVPTGKNKSEKEKTDTQKSNMELQALFEKFWQSYPRKVAKDKAFISFKKINPNEDMVKIMITVIEKNKTTAQWQKENGRYIPYPATWLNQKRWEDKEPEIPKKTNINGLSESSLDKIAINSLINKFDDINNMSGYIKDKSDNKWSCYENIINNFN